MQTTKKKPFWLMIIPGAFLAAYLGYLAAGACAPGRRLDEFMAVFSYILEKPFANYINEFTLKGVVIALMVYSMAVIMYYTSQRNFMPGREFGSARFANVKQVCKVLQDKDEDRNRVLSQNVKMSLDTRHTKLNNNVLIIGGSGAGKTFFEVKPNLMQMPKNCSFVITDPKGEIVRSCGGMLKKNGYNVKVLNLLEMDKSDCYNPFDYIREETDVVKLITNLIKNTTPKGSNPPDPFWERAEGLLLQAIFYYVWMEVKPEKRNFETVLKLIGEAKVSDKGEPSRLDLRMKYLEETHPLKDNHPAVKQYNKCMRGAGDTIRSIIISVNARLAYLENKQVLRLLSKDDMNIAELGIGVNGDGQTKTALFCVIPDSDKSYNFIVGLLYTQIFQELYRQADFNCGGRLPIHVSFMLDEFCNVALPDDFCSLLSTMRSREISSMIIIQNLAQLKALFKDTWETVPGNCDTLIYLGGNEASTHEYISKLLGKATIDKRTSGETKGRQGSSSRNYDVLGRELLTPDEARKFDNKKCLIFIRGFDPILDQKFNPFSHKAFSQTEDGGAPAYIHKVDGGSEASKEKAFELLTQESVKYYEKLLEKGENVYIDRLEYKELESLTDVEVKRRFIESDETKARERMYKEIEDALEYEDPKMEQEYVEDMDEAFEHRNDGVADDMQSEAVDSQKTDNISAAKNSKNQQLKYPQNTKDDKDNNDKTVDSKKSKKRKVRTLFDVGSGNTTGNSSEELYETDSSGGDGMDIVVTETSETDAIIDEVSKAHIDNLMKKRPNQGKDSIIIRMTTMNYSMEQINILNKAYKLRMPIDKIMRFFYPSVDVKDMERIVTSYEKCCSSGGGGTVMTRKA